MANHFFRFPQTPHVTWLGTDSPREDKVLSKGEVADLLSSEVLVEEKLDGANLGISIDSNFELQVQNRGQYLRTPFTGQFSRLNGWLGQHSFRLIDNLRPGQILFGEWCAARHSMDYTSLPDWFLLFDVYDLQKKKFWSSHRRNSFASKLGLKVVPNLYQGKIELNQLVELLANSESHYRAGPPEGIIIRKQSDQWCEARAKLVRASFSQSIEDHWRSRLIEWNELKHE
jgi:ATP-dependent RNA circularization protein (DNA/RNA ligase family)|tara:strand:- start:12122 stop:12808 length:687 start_codon:yes stop_codon:yes gene_type:complete